MNKITLKEKLLWMQSNKLKRKKDVLKLIKEEDRKSHQLIQLNNIELDEFLSE